MYRNLTDYIQEQWIESTIFTPKDWSVFKQPIQTNNDIEGWHNTLNRRAGGQCRLQFYLLIVNDKKRTSMERVDRPLQATLNPKKVSEQTRLLDLRDVFYSQPRAKTE